MTKARDINDILREDGPDAALRAFDKAAYAFPGDSPPNGSAAGREHADSTSGNAGLGEWDAGDDTGLPPPRGWLLGNIFCRGFLSSLLGDGAVGKTALRYAQYLSLATGRALTGEHVFQRCRVLIVSLEDDPA